MGDVFKEQLVKKRPDGVMLAKRAGYVAAWLFVTLIAAIIIPQLFLFVGLGLGFFAYWLMGRLKLEYEYIFTNGDLDIDVIYGGNSRKRVFTGDVKTDAVEIVVPTDERGYDGQFGKATVKRNCGSGEKGAKGYRLLCNYKGKRMEIIFEPNDAMLAAMSPYLGQRKLVKRK